MSRCPTRKVKKRRLSHKTASLDRFNDLVYIDLRKPDTEIKPLQLDEDLPGMGQFYCLHCDVKIMNGPAPHSQLDADLAVGMAMPNNQGRFLGSATCAVAQGPKIFYTFSPINRAHFLFSLLFSRVLIFFLVFWHRAHITLKANTAAPANNGPKLMTV